MTSGVTPVSTAARAVCRTFLVGPGGFEPPTSTMSRPIGRTKTRVDAQNLAPFHFVFTPRLYLF